MVTSTMKWLIAWLMAHIATSVTNITSRNRKDKTMEIKTMIRMIWNTLYTKPKNWLFGLQTDKVLHFVVSMLLVQMIFFLTYNLWLATLATFVIGIFKEVVIDKLVSKEKVDADDMWADIFGVCAGVIALVVGAALIHIHEWLWCNLI